MCLHDLSPGYLNNLALIKRTILKYIPFVIAHKLKKYILDFCLFGSGVCEIHLNFL